MRAERFDEILTARMAKMRSTLGNKATDYATAADRLHNFKRSAAILNCTPERALLGFLTKHLVSVLDMVEGIENCVASSKAKIDEKLGDAINYFVLLEAVMIERIETET